MYRVARGTPALGVIPHARSCIYQDIIEHFQRRRLGVIDVASTTVPSCSDIGVERTGELAFKSGEDAARLVLETGAIVHDVRDDIDAWCRALFPARSILFGKGQI